MNRADLLKQKSEEFRKKLQEWAEKNIHLAADEYLSLDISIKRRPIVEVRVSVLSSPGRTEITNPNLTLNDWDKIFALPLPIKMDAILWILRGNNNKPLGLAEIQERLKKRELPSHLVRRNLTPQQIESYNYFFSRRALPYRIKRCNLTDFWYKVYIVRQK